MEPGAPPFPEQDTSLSLLFVDESKIVGAHSRVVCEGGQRYCLQHVCSEPEAWKISYDKTKTGLIDILFTHPRKWREGRAPSTWIRLSEIKHKGGAPGLAGSW